MIDNVSNIDDDDEGVASDDGSGNVGHIDDNNTAEKGEDDRIGDINENGCYW